VESTSARRMLGTHWSMRIWRDADIWGCSFMCRCSETFRSFKVSISIDRVLLRSYKVSNSLDQVLLRSYKVYIGRYEHLIWHRTSGDVPSCAGTVKHKVGLRYRCCKALILVVTKEQ
jgi:hypothetical protein